MKRLIFLFGLLVLLPSACAWNKEGHMTMAALSYRLLDEATRKELVQILKAHPWLPKWQAGFERGDKDVDFDLFIFMQAAAWPDEIRRQRAYDHATWHYINNPIRGNYTEPKPDRVKTESKLVAMLEQTRKNFFSKNRTAEARAIDLCWLIHLMADLHQPLHNVSFFSNEFPKGDRGGNLFLIRPNRAEISLHKFWDGLLGTSEKPRSANNQAIELQSRIPREELGPELKGPIDFAAWSKESGRLAIQYCYKGLDAKKAAKPGNAPALPNGYSKKAKALAEWQIVLASYRFAELVKEK